ncbi:cytochrome P450 [Seohaeicola zhoushanensis]|uniref:Cytochrome P450 n=1 Tax=Seohaeicola zhoushanensis TaxID=1569283 RepID=A0A8J3GU95_9RHOB|nr:cytochrome P450 [Seohaeicola zhoushanensis]GHF34500.1 cytochrome P450 [Seohaeicola zhoushanensis]
MPLKIRDIPQFPEYIQGQTDHQFMANARAQGPFARDRFGIVSAFSMAHLNLIMDDRWTRQVELETMRAAGVASGPMFDFVRGVMLFANDETHRHRRGPLVRSFAHKLIAELRPEVARRTEALVPPLAGAGSVDFLTALAGPLPAQMIAAIVGAPDKDIPFFADHVYSAIRGLSLCSDEVRIASDHDMGWLQDYVDRLIARRRDHPEEDLLTGFLDRVRGGPLDENEVRAQILGLIVAGSDTTRGALTATVSQLLQHPEQWAMVVEDPETWAAPAVAEGLRFDPVIGALVRFTTEPREIEGVLFPPQSLIAVSMLTALRDPAVYADPDRFDITRTDHPRLHPVFGGGPHRCLGEALARIELEEALKSLARHLPHMALDGPPPVLRGYGAVRAVSQMHIRC